MASFSNLGFEDPKTRSAMRGYNEENFNPIINGRMLREPLRVIYIHTVARRTRPPVTKTLFPKLTLHACENGERYVTCTSIPDPIVQASPDQERGGTRPDEHDGWRAAIDLLNPSNTTNDPYAGTQNPDFFANRSGQNLIAEGDWPSLNKFPPEEEIRRGEKHRDQRYRYLTGEATRLAAISTKDLNEFLVSYPDTHVAMAALRMKANWTSSPEVTMNCPNCGDEIKQVAFHKSSVTEKLCVIDPEKAFQAKAITREEYEDLVTAPAQTKPVAKKV